MANGIFEELSQAKAIVHKNMMEVSKLTGIHFNSLKKVLTFPNPPSAVEQIAFHNYLNDIKDVLIKIIEAEIPDK